MLKCQIFNYFYKFSSYHKIPSNQQFCFYPGFFAETTMLSTLTYLFSSLDINNANNNYAIFLSSKAFDFVPSESIINYLSYLNDYIIAYLYSIISELTCLLKHYKRLAFLPVSNLN